MRKPMAIGRIYKTPEQACNALRKNGFKPLDPTTWKLVFDKKIFTATLAVVGSKFRTQITVIVGE